MNTHTRTCECADKKTKKQNKGKGHQMRLKMINAGWDRHTLTMNLLCSRRSPEASPIFLAKMSLSNWFASHITGQQGCLEEARGGAGGILRCWVWWG